MFKYIHYQVHKNMTGQKPTLDMLQIKHLVDYLDYLDYLQLDVLHVACSQHTLSDSDCVSRLWTESASCGCLGSCVSLSMTSVMFCSNRRKNMSLTGHNHMITASREKNLNSLLTRTCVSSGTFSCVFLSAKGSVTLSVVF